MCLVCTYSCSLFQLWCWIYKIFINWWTLSHNSHIPRSFPVAASILWNSLPPDIQSSSPLTEFCHRLKTFLFHQSFLQTFCFNASYIDYISVNFVRALLILATLKLSLMIVVIIIIQFIFWQVLRAAFISGDRLKVSISVCLDVTIELRDHRVGQ